MIVVVIMLVVRVIAIFAAITLFEFSKAAVSTVLGDKNPKNSGWLTLNPLKFFEPIGFFLFLFYGYGWGQSAETSSLFYKNRKQGTLFTYGLPIIICIVLGKAVIIAGDMLYGTVAASMNETVAFCIYWLINQIGKLFINIGVFNIIPIMPMAGSKILKTFLSPNAAMNYTQNEKLYQMIFMFAWFLGFIPQILNTIVGFLY